MACKSLLLIEDNHLTASLLREALESEGFKVATCYDGPSAVEMTREKCFNTILTDYQMPTMNGADLTKILRSMCPESFIIGISVERRDQDFLSAGANAFMNKPIVFQELIAVIKRYS